MAEGGIRRGTVAFFDQILRCIKRGNLVSIEGFKELPADFAAEGPKTDARFAFFAGQDNLCFLPVSQENRLNIFQYPERLPYVASVAELWPSRCVYGEKCRRDTFSAAHCRAGPVKNGQITGKRFRSLL